MLIQTPKFSIKYDTMIVYFYCSCNNMSIDTMEFNKMYICLLGSNYINGWYYEKNKKIKYYIFSTQDDLLLLLLIILSNT